MVASESTIVRVFGVIALLMLAFIVLPPLFELDVFGIDALNLLGFCLIVDFVAGLLTRSYWTLVCMPPVAVVALMTPVVIESAQFRALLDGQFPSQATIMGGVEILFMVFIWMLLGFFFFFTPGVLAGVWLGRRLLRHLSLS